jgi:hypothetical protein
MIHRCEICGQRKPKAEIYTRKTKVGKPKNLGECDNCADEWREKLPAMLKGVVFVDDQAVITPQAKYDVREGPGE